MSKLLPEELPAHRALAVKVIQQAVNADTLDNPLQRKGAESLCAQLGLDFDAAKQGVVAVRS